MLIKCPVCSAQICLISVSFSKKIESFQEALTEVVLMCVVSAGITLEWG